MFTAIWPCVGADVSALGAGSQVRIIEAINIIGPHWLSL
jgi:hypothetical protein